MSQQLLLVTFCHSRFHKLQKSCDIFEKNFLTAVIKHFTVYMDDVESLEDFDEKNIDVNSILGGVQEGAGKDE